MKHLFLTLVLFITQLSFGQLDFSITSGTNVDKVLTFSGEVRYSFELNEVDHLYLTPSVVLQQNENTDYQNFFRLGLTKEYGILNVTTGIETSNRELTYGAFAGVIKKDNFKVRPFIRFDAPLFSYNPNKKDVKLVLDVDRQAFSVGFGLQF